MFNFSQHYSFFYTLWNGRITCIVDKKLIIVDNNASVYDIHWIITSSDYKWDHYNEIEQINYNNYINHYLQL